VTGTYLAKRIAARGGGIAAFLQRLGTRRLVAAAADGDQTTSKKQTARSRYFPTSRYDTCCNTAFAK